MLLTQNAKGFYEVLIHLQRSYQRIPDQRFSDINQILQPQCLGSQRFSVEASPRSNQARCVDQRSHKEMHAEINFNISHDWT